MKKRPQFGEPFSKALNGDASSIGDLTGIVVDKLNPPIIRAAATRYLGDYPSQKSYDVIKEMLNDPNPMIRNEAVISFPANVWDEYVRYLSPMLTDSIRMVRMSATSVLAAVPSENIDSVTKVNLQKGVKEYVEAMNYGADFAASRHNLGNLYSNLGELDKAEENYKEAIRIDNLFYPAKINLAMLYNRKGDNNRAEILLKDVIKNHPELPDTYYSLGLLMAEEGNYEAAAGYLKKASELMPDRPRVHYNLALTLQYLKRMPEAEKAFLNAWKLDPENGSYISSLVGFYLDTDNKSKARKYLVNWMRIYPEDKSAQDMLDEIEGK